MVHNEHQKAQERIRSGISSFVKPDERYVNLTDQEAATLTDQPGYPYEDRPGWYYRLYLIEPNWTTCHRGPFPTTGEAIEHARVNIDHEWLGYAEYLRSKWGRL